jgi:hypothetical protein
LTVGFRGGYKEGMSQKESAFFEGSIRERVIVALASPPLAVVCTNALIAMHTGFTGRNARDWRDRLMDRLFLAIFETVARKLMFS